MRTNSIYSPVTINFSAADRARIKYQLTNKKLRKTLQDRGFIRSSDFQKNAGKYFIFVSADKAGDLEREYGEFVSKTQTVEDQAQEFGFTLITHDNKKRV